MRVMIGFMFLGLLLYLNALLGIFDHLYFNRMGMGDRALHGVQVASQYSGSKEVYALIAQLDASFRPAVTASLRRLAELQSEGQLAPKEQSDVADALFSTMLDGGYWWRLGWDEDEDEFAEFYAVSLETLNLLDGQPEAILTSHLRSEREAERTLACEIILHSSENTVRQLADSAILVELLRQAASGEDGHQGSAKCLLGFEKLQLLLTQQD